MLLSVSHLGVSYGARAAIADVSFTVNAGEVVALLGPNGSGKSTLLRALLGQHPSSGSVTWQDKALAQWRRRDLAREVAYLAQVPAWEPGQTVGEALLLGRAPYQLPFGVESRDDLEVVADAARRLNLEDLLSRPLESLSGGQRQRVFVGRCLVQQPKVLLLDEPNTHLDLRHQVELGQLLRSLAGEHGLAVLMASHDLNLAGAFADRLILLSEGKLVADGEPGRVLNPQILEPVYGVPLVQMNTVETQLPVIVPKVIKSAKQGSVR
jgi:iron complex transport system ATP-binding protein